MSQKTENFKNDQIQKWADGELANGANFSQLLTAIATLIDEAAAEATSNAVEQANAAKVSEDRIKEIAKALFNTADDYSTTEIYTTLKGLVDAKKDEAGVKELIASALNTEGDYADKAIYTALKGYVDQQVAANKVKAFNYDEDAKAQVGSDIDAKLSEVVPAKVKELVEVYEYTYVGGVLKLFKNGEEETLNVTDGAKFVKEATEKTLAQKLSSTKVLLLRPDGARLVYDRATSTVKPAANLIG